MIIYPVLILCDHDWTAFQGRWVLSPADFHCTACEADFEIIEDYPPRSLIRNGQGWKCPRCHTFQPLRSDKKDTDQ
jgi:DNA-directed RNA polymerase subunit RPC12/RpoP